MEIKDFEGFKQMSQLIDFNGNFIINIENPTNNSQQILTAC